jgi:hypothetical protein
VSDEYWAVKMDSFSLVRDVKKKYSIVNRDNDRTGENSDKYHEKKTVFKY